MQKPSVKLFFVHGLMSVMFSSLFIFLIPGLIHASLAFGCRRLGEKHKKSFVSCHIIACLLSFCLFHVSAIWCCSFTLYKLEHRTASLPCVMSCLYSYRISIVFVRSSLRRGSVDLNEGKHMQKRYTKRPGERMFFIKSIRNKDKVKGILFTPSSFLPLFVQYFYLSAWGTSLNMPTRLRRNQ